MNKKVEKKLKAYYAVDEYSFNCLIKELEEQEYDVEYAKDYCPGKDVVYIEKDETIMGSSLRYYEEYEKDHYELIEYYKDPKPKAYHVKDEDRYNELMKKLEEQGYATRYGIRPTETNYWDYYKQETVIYCEKDRSITYSQLSYYETEQKDNYDLIEYHEEPLYYAALKVPAGINTYSWLKQLNYDNTVFDLVSWFQLDQNDAKTKTEWGKLGINNTNVNFKEVEK